MKRTKRTSKLKSVTNNSENKKKIYIERRILIGLIQFDEICEFCVHHFDPLLFEAPTPRQLGLWCINFYQNYGEAPRKNIKTTYFRKLDAGEIPEDEAEELEEDILPGLSNEYVNKDINVDQLKDAILEYRSDRLKEKAKGALEEGYVEKAGEFLSDINIGNQDKLILRDMDDYSNRKRPKAIIKPWLREKRHTLLYADKGVGKTMFTTMISNIGCREKYDDPVCEIDTDRCLYSNERHDLDPKKQGKSKYNKDIIWQTDTPFRTMYVAGEMGLGIQDRFKDFDWIGKYIDGFKPILIDRNEIEAEKNITFDLTDRSIQQLIIDRLKNLTNVKLLILDNVQTLFDLESSTDEREWNNTVGRFLGKLEQLNVHCILVDHTGKNPARGAGGTHAKITQVSNEIFLQNHADNVNGQGNQKNQAWFHVIPKKQRHLEDTFKNFCLRYSRSPKGTQWKVTGDRLEDY